jgi:hypothetical protein
MIWNDAGMAETGKRWSDHPKHKRNKKESAAAAQKRG